jgi:uncharacterized protein YjbJ (UPF0337 family)
MRKATGSFRSELSAWAGSFQNLFSKGAAMNWDQIEGNWKQFKGQVREYWGKLTDDEVEQIAGKKDKLLGKVQEKYGLTKEDAQRQLSDFERNCQEVHEPTVR